MLERSKIESLNEAHDYVMASAKAAAGGVCPSKASAYKALADKIASGAFGTNTVVGWSFTDETGGFNASKFFSALQAVDSACKTASDYNSYVAKELQLGQSSSVLPILIIGAVAFFLLR